MSEMLENFDATKRIGENRSFIVVNFPLAIFTRNWLSTNSLVKAARWWCVAMWCNQARCRIWIKARYADTYPVDISILQFSLLRRLRVSDSFAFSTFIRTRTFAFVYILVSAYMYFRVRALPRESKISYEDIATRFDKLLTMLANKHTLYKRLVILAWKLSGVWLLTFWIKIWIMHRAALYLIMHACRKKFISSSL